MWAVDLQRTRFLDDRLDDFAMWRWWDFHCFLIALRRLRLAARIASDIPSLKSKVEAATQTFDAAVPALKLMRDVGEHIDAYALDDGRESVDKPGRIGISRKALQVARWDGTEVEYLGHRLNLDGTFAAAQALYGVVRDARLEP